MADEYKKYTPAGENIQNAVKDYLRELYPVLRFEVYTTVGRIDCVRGQTIYEVCRVEAGTGTTLRLKDPLRRTQIDPIPIWFNAKPENAEADYRDVPPLRHRRSLSAVPNAH